MATKTTWLVRAGDAASHIEDLVGAILEHYERMDPDSQRLIPLRKIYWPG